MELHHSSCRIRLDNFVTVPYLELHAHRQPGTAAAAQAGVPFAGIRIAGALYTQATAGGLTMREDPIVAEVHRIRQQLLAEFDGDVDAYSRYVRRIEAEKRKQGVQFVEPPPPPGVSPCPRPS